MSDEQIPISQELAGAVENALGGVLAKRGLFVQGWVMQVDYTDGETDSFSVVTPESLSPYDACSMSDNLAAWFREMRRISYYQVMVGDVVDDPDDWD